MVYKILEDRPVGGCAVSHGGAKRGGAGTIPPRKGSIQPGFEPVPGADLPNTAEIMPSPAAIPGRLRFPADPMTARFGRNRLIAAGCQLASGGFSRTMPGDADVRLVCHARIHGSCRAWSVSQPLLISSIKQSLEARRRGERSRRLRAPASWPAIRTTCNQRCPGQGSAFPQGTPVDRTKSHLIEKEKNIGRRSS